MISVQVAEIEVVEPFTGDALNPVGVGKVIWLTVIVNVLDVTDSKLASVAVIEIEYVPAVVGTPEIQPFDVSKLRPVGKDPSWL